MSQLGQITSLLSSGVTSLTGDSGGALSGALKIKGGSNITTAAAGTDITVNVSGTTNHAIQLGNVGGSLSSLAVGATGTVLTGVTGADPAFSATPTVTTIYAGTFDTNVTAAGVTLSGTTLSADGTDVDININITAKGTGKVIIDDLQLTTDLAVTEGGTGVSTLLDHGLLIGSGAAAIDSLAVGATGEILIGNTGADASWSSTPTVTTIYATTFDTNVAAAAVTLAGTTLSADGTDVDININITAKGAGKVIIDDLQLTTDLAVTEGGTGVSTLTDHGLLVGSGAAAIDALSVGATGTILTGVTGADPTWTTATYPSTVTKGDVLVASANNVVGVVNDVVNAGYVLTANAAAAPTFQALPSSVTFASDAETIAGTVTNKAVAPSNLKAKLGTQTVHALPIGNSDSLALNWLAVGANGETLMGSTGADCGWTNSPQFGGSVTATNDITSTAGSISSLSGSMISRDATNTSTGPSAYFQKVRVAATIQSGDELGKMRFTGYDGTSYITGAKITSTNSGTVATNRIAGDLRFYTHPDSVVALPSEPTLRMTIASTGAVTIASPDSGVGLTVSGGGITCSSGTIAASSGAVSASTTVTAGTNLISTAGNLELPTSTSTIGQIKNGSVRMYHMTTGASMLPGYGENIFWGNGAGNVSANGYGGNIGIGKEAIASVTTGYSLIGIGYQALNKATNASNNFGFGYQCLYNLIGDTGSGGGFFNLGIGLRTLYSITYGQRNVAIGNMDSPYCAGNLTNGDSNNIIIMNNGVAGDNNTMRLGTSGSGVAQVNRAFIAGIYGVTPGGTQNVALVDSNGQFGSTATLPPSLGGAMTWTEVTGTSQAAAVNNGYITNNVALVTVTLPSTAAVGQRVAITGKGAGLWKLAQNSGQTVHYGSTDSTTGATGYLAATVRYDCVEVQCTTANTDWVVIRSVGTITVA